MKDTIIIHCLDVPANWNYDWSVESKMAEVRRWHVEERGWRDVAYAFLIDRDGTYATGRDIDGDGDVIEETGAHAKGWNRRSVAIALVGGKGGKRTDRFLDNYTEAQQETLRQLIALINAYVGDKLNVIGHNEVANKECPAFDVQRWKQNAIRRAANSVAGKVSVGTVAGVGLLATLAKCLGG